MILDAIIVPGVDPPDILRRTMNHCLVVAIIPAVLFLSSEAISGNFTGFGWKGSDLKQTGIVIMALACFVGQYPLGFWIDFVGTRKLRDYINRNAQILERQLMGALARLFRTSQISRVYLVAFATTLGLFDCLMTRSVVGLSIYIVGQAMLVYLLPWPFRWDLWQGIRRKMILE